MNANIQTQNSSVVRRCLEGLYLASGWLAATCIALICLLVLCQVCLNAIDRISGLLTGTAIGLTIPSYADFTGFFLAAASFLALAYTFRQGEHIRVTLFLSHCQPKVQHLLEIWGLLMACGVTLYFSWYTFLLVRESYIYHDLSAGMIAIPIWIPQTFMLLGLIVLAIALIDGLVNTILNGFASVNTESTEHPTCQK